MEFKIELTWSKIVALIILVMAFIIDLKNDSNSLMMFALPFVVVLITGKQVVDLKKKNNGKSL